MRHFSSRSPLFLLCMLFAAMQFASAQSSDTGGISGVAKDQTGAVIVGAQVSAVNTGNNAQASATTDGNGRYLVGLLQPGTYSVAISAQGFGTLRHANVIVEVGRSTPLDFTMKPAALATMVVTTAQAPVVETERSEFSTNINQETMQNSPVNVRRWSTFALSTPGATPDGTFGLTSFRGISGLLNNNTVDGTDNNQAFFAEEKGRSRISYSISEDSIQEFQVTTSNYSAEYGRAAGGVVNAVTKSGANSLHGTAYWYYRDSDFGPTNPFFLVPGPVVNGVITQAAVNPPDKRHQFGGTVGGALIKDKLFYFFSGDQQLRNFPGVATPSNPSVFFAALSPGELLTLSGRGVSAAHANSAFSFLETLAGTVPRTGDELVLFPKIDWNATPKNHASFEYNRMRWASPAGIQTAAVVNRGIESFGSDYVKNDTAIARLTSTLNSALVNEARFNYGRDFEFETGQPSIAGEPVASSTGVSPQVTVGGAASFVFGKPNFLDRPAYPDERRTEVSDTLSWSRGKHLLKFGGDINHVNDVFNNLFGGAGVYTYSSRVDFITDYTAYQLNPASPPKLCSGLPCYSSFSQGFGPPAFQFATWDFGFFANDDWRIAPRLTLTLGMRWEYEKMPPPQVPNPALPLTSQFPGDRGDFGPRLGFALDLGGSQHKTVLRGGYGVYFGRIINSTISNAITTTGFISGGTAFSQISSSFRNVTPNAPVYPNIATGLGNITPPSVVQFATDTKLPLVHQYDLAFEREIAKNTAVSVSYLGSQGRRLPVFLDTNLAVPTRSVSYQISQGPMNGQIFTVPLFTSRINPAFGAITDIAYVAQSQYNGLVVGVNRRMTHGVQVQTSYTYSHASDQGQSSTTFTSFNNVVNPYALFAEQGRSIFDVRHRLAGSAIWQPQYFHNKGTLARWLGDGFSFSPVVSAASGAPYSGFVSGNLPTGFVPSACTGCTGIIGAGGSARAPFIPRDSYTAPSLLNVDLRVSKKFWYKERASFELIADAFNILNKVNATQISGALVGGPSGTSQFVIGNCQPAAVNPNPCGGTLNPVALNYQSTFGNTTNTSSTLGGPGQRQIQIGARLNW